MVQSGCVLGGRKITARSGQSCCESDVAKWPNLTSVAIVGIPAFEHVVGGVSLVAHHAYASPVTDD